MSARRLFPLWRCRVVTGWLVAVAAPCQAYEADVHFGLTQWLARAAGYTAGQATAIAAGNSRIDSGLIATMEFTLEHACVGEFPEAAADVQRRHFPSAVTVPARPEARAVVAGSAAARKPVDDTLAKVIGKEGLMLSKYGEALHTLQDSWSYAGVPGIPEPGAGISCNPDYASAPPPGGAGSHPHRAALTYTHADAAVSMAAASYQALLAYPPIAGASRRPESWDALVPLLEQFARARTKTEKRDWFVARGIDDTGFLHHTTLPDGPRPGALEFMGRMLPPLQSATSNQHDAAPEVKAFFDALFARWLGTESVESVVTALGVDPAAPPRAAGSGARASQPGNASTDPGLRQLTARLKLWKLRDHGSAAVLAHARAPLSAAQLAAVDRLARAPGAYVQPDELRNAFFPLLPKSNVPSPLLPYVVRELKPGPTGRARSIAITRLRHAPYDTLGVIAERDSRGWVLVDVVFTVDQ
jgi:hypothetical protein